MFMCVYDILNVISMKEGDVMAYHTIEFLEKRKDELKWKDAYFAYLKEHKDDPEWAYKYKMARKERIRGTITSIIITILIVGTISTILIINYPEACRNIWNKIVDVLTHTVIV